VQENPDHYGKSVVVYNQRILAVGKGCPGVRGIRAWSNRSITATGA
jgi:hypothetical protein